MVETNEKREKEKKEGKGVCVNERKRILEGGKLMMKKENPFVHLISRKKITERKKSEKKERNQNRELFLLKK